METEDIYFVVSQNTDEVDQQRQQPWNDTPYSAHDYIRSIGGI